MGFDLNRLFDNNIDESFLCPICCGIIQNPKTIIKCEHIFCEECIVKWVSIKQNCPINECESRVDDLSLGDVSQTFTANYSAILLKCKNSKLGCNEIIRIADESYHVENCKYDRDNFYNCECGDLVNIKGENHSCVEYLKYQIQNLKSTQIKLELINRELEIKLKQKSEECFQMKGFINFSKQLDTTSELRDLIEALKDLKMIRSTIVEKTLLSVDRRVFCPQNPYNNHKTDIGFGAEFNSPVIDSIVLEALKSHLVVGAQILDIGCGTGYLTVCMAMMCANQCKVIAVEHIPELIERAKINSRTIFGENNCIEFIEGDGRSGYPSLGPYDVINIGLSVEELPQILLNQLKVCGRMCCAIGSECGPQDLTIIDKLSDGSVERQSLLKVSLKPITTLNKQINTIV